MQQIQHGKFPSEGFARLCEGEVFRFGEQDGDILVEVQHLCTEGEFKNSHAFLLLGNDS